LKEDGALEGFGDISAALGREEIGLPGIPFSRPVCRQHLLCAIDTHFWVIGWLPGGAKKNGAPKNGGVLAMA